MNNLQSTAISRTELYRCSKAHVKGTLGCHLQLLSHNPLYFVLRLISLQRFSFLFPLSTLSHIPLLVLLVQIHDFILHYCYTQICMCLYKALEEGNRPVFAISPRLYREGLLRLSKSPHPKSPSESNLPPLFTSHIYSTLYFYLFTNFILF